MYQLRRLNVACESRTSSSNAFEDETVLLLETTKIGRNPEAVDVVLTSTVHSNMISRIHSTIEAKQDNDRIVYILTDQSLNGTYINDYRAKGPTELKPGDIIKFGHVNGAAIRAGCHGPQHSAEFTFIFEKAPPDRMERRRPITIVGSARNATETSTLPSQVLSSDARNLHSAQRLPLPTTSVDFPNWQNAGASANPATSFYNLQRLPGYYSAAFSQLNPAYLQSLWQQNPWQQPAAAAQQLQQQQQHKQQQGLMSESLMDSSWMTASVASDLGVQSSATTGGHFRAPTIQQAVPHSQPLASSTASMHAAVGSQNPQSVARFATNFAGGMMPPGANLLTSFAQRMCQQPSTSAVASGAVPSNAAAMAVAGFPLSATSHLATVASSSPVVTAASAASPAPNVENVKRMECDSSVPSPPKTQQSAVSTTTAAGGTSFHSRLLGASSSSVTNVKPTSSSSSTATNSSLVANNPSISSSALPSSSATAMLLTQSKNASKAVVGSSVVAAETTTKQPLDESHTQIDEISRPRFSPASLSPETANAKEQAPTNAVESSRSLTSRSPVAKPESTILSPRERSQSRSPSHHSPKRRGHGHSESSRSRSPTPLVSDQEKASGKRCRKSNEVARLLNDLTEGAWMRVARKSGKKGAANNSQTRDETSNGEEEESSWSDSQESDKEQKKVRRKPTRKSKNPSDTIVSDSTERRRRGRPPKRTKRKSVETAVSKRGALKRGAPPPSGSSSSESVSENEEDEEGDEEKKPMKQVKRPASGGGRALRRKTEAVSVTPSSQSNTSTPKKRGRPPRTPAIFAEVSSDSSLLSSDSSISPRPRRKYIVPQRKVGMAPSTSTKKSAPSTRSRTKQSAKRGSKKKTSRKRVSIKKATTSKRRKRNSTSSSSESESKESQSDAESPSPSTNQVVFDEWSYHDPEKRCDAKTKCKKPQGENVDWVQCDYCDLWYHVECVVGYSEVLDEAGEFDCGCKKKASRKRGRK
uniref:FHA domain-containing protein n=1 Tax=Parascaris univalens TaxID=6257 RepID=A0A915B331_PARUN